MNLTKKQLAIYRYLRQYIEAKGLSPTYDEIRQHFGFQSFQSVQKHLAQLERKGHIRIPERNRSRMITLIEHGGTTTVLPLSGIVAAGSPIEAIEQQETVDVPEEMLGSGEYFALKVRGNSMMDEGIVDGDTIVVRKQATAENGQTVVALVEGEATVKKVFRRRDGVELKPANASMSSIFVKNGEFTIQGVVVGLLRKYK
ncbi:transcriptional repressor LexA [bacterium]|nr:transcriptional repressor LexA [bacterium]RQV94292.1 MAG: transcriptional repressor LexA [bacterium]